MKYSIIVVTWNAVEHVVRCIDSVLRNSRDYELIVVDNGSTDGTIGYLQSMKDAGKIHKLILNQENKNFGPANNQGYEVAEGERIVLLNSDTVVTISWLDKMARCFEHRDDIAIVGCMSNSSNGRQMVSGVHSGYHDLEHNALAWSQKNFSKYFEVGIVYGWCMMINRKFLKDEPYLFDPQFANSYEDNDLCLRARLKGWKLFIDQGTYIFHHGQGSFQKGWGEAFLKNYMKNGHENQDRFFAKWKPEEKQKLVAVYRIANCEKYIRESMERTSEFADEIVVLIARSQDRTEEIARSFPKVSVVEVWTPEEHPFDEQAERNWLLQKAIERGATWVISVDGDEVYEKKFVEMVPKLLRNPNPQVFGYWCNWRTIWDTVAGKEMYRADGIFGGFQNYRFHKVLPGMRIEPNDNIYNHHCGSAPSLPTENLQWINVRVRHLGYDTEEQRKKKHAFYLAQDPHPLAKDVGNKDYHHLVDRKVDLKVYTENNRVSVMSIVKDEEEHIFAMMKNVEPLADEFLIVDTGSIDGTLAEIARFASQSTKPVRVIERKFTVDEKGMLMNYSEAKNFAKSECRFEWILQMDADELFIPEQVPHMFGFIDEEIDGFLFNVCNYMEPPVSNKPEENKFSISETIRLFRNRKELFYSGLIHESLEDCMKARAKLNKGFVLQSPIVLHHRGYLKPRVKVREKFERYEKINHRQFKVSGDRDPRPLFNLALHKANEGDEIEAVRLYKKSLEICPTFWRSSQNLAFINLERAKNLLGQTMDQVPTIYKENSKPKEIFDYLSKFNFGMHRIN